jgi:hypothetical protein
MAENNEWAEKGQWADPDKWGDHGWDHGTGAPTLTLMGHAIQVWSLLQQREVTTVAEAAIAFNVPAATIRAAVQEHMWMFLSGPDDEPSKQTIEHEGE